MRGEQEQKCLDSVKSILKTRKNCLGCLDENDEFFDCINTAQANTQASKFPDFVFEGGFIEHFQISASKETSKGALYRQQRSIYKREVKQKSEENTRRWMCEDFKPNTVTTIPHDFTFDKNSYEYFVDSFKRNFEKHIESLQKYNGQKGKGIFLIELTDAMLFIEKPSSMESYSLLFDKKLLTYIYGFKDVLNYVVFTNGEYVDIVKISRMPKIMQYVPNAIRVKAGRTCSVTVQVFCDI